MIFFQVILGIHMNADEYNELRHRSAVRPFMAEAAVARRFGEAPRRRSAWCDVLLREDGGWRSRAAPMADCSLALWRSSEAARLGETEERCGDEMERDVSCFASFRATRG
jgi:hypothetical protein